MAKANTAAKPRGPFTTYPPDGVIQDFLRHVATTGTPDTWTHHSASVPAKDSPFEEMESFEVPHRLRSAVAKATCPVCSPAAPKYYRGVLAWFYEEGLLRAIGHECSESHFGAELTYQAKALNRRRRARDDAQQFLLAILPEADTLKAEAAALVAVAQAMDRFRDVVWNRAGQRPCEMLARLGERGVLTIEDRRPIHGVDAFGKPVTRWESRTVATFPVVGLNFLRKPKVLTQSHAGQTLTAFEHVRAMDPEAALQLVAEDLRADDDLLATERIVRSAVDSLANLRAVVAEARQLLRPSNLTELAEWSTHPLSGSPVAVEYNAAFPALVTFCGPTQTARARPIPIPPALLG